LAITIRTNAASTFSQRMIGNNVAKTKQNTERLSSGSRINHGADDAAGLSISEKNRSTLRGLAQASRNIQDAFGFLTTADGAFNEITNIVSRLRELAVQRASDTIGDVERGMVEEEFAALKAEIERIAGTTEYNGVRLLDGSYPKLDVQVDSAADSSSRISIDTTGHDMRLPMLGIEGTSVRTKQQAQEALLPLSKATDRVSEARAEMGALINRLESSRSNIGNYQVSLSAAQSRIRDTDVAEESSENVRNTIMTNAGAAMLSQANQMPTQSLKLLT
jgi:flagellin